MSFDDHERFVAKNRSLAAAENIERRDEAMENKGYSYLREQKDSSCFNCKMKNTCREFGARRSGGTSGVVSFGGDERLICDKYEPAEKQKKTMSDKQVKALLKNVRKGY
ncbi:MAG: hypothetical protein FWC23_05760 [Chitinispirillia bacterium]|nr:hypothetical protein [Chitinispirillia bacterium]MCL2268673.1 hypothetical protein [Chitinispirillia bacterium]